MYYLVNRNLIILTDLKRKGFLQIKVLKKSSAFVFSYCDFKNYIFPNSFICLCVSLREV